MKKSNIQELYHTNPEIFINNAKHKFRAKDQFSFIAFFKAIQINRGNDNNVNQREVYIAKSLPLRKKLRLTLTKPKYICLQRFNFLSKRSQNYMTKYLNKSLLG